MSAWRRNAGYSLVEILASLVVLSVGLLSLAALQTTALRYNHTAQLRSVAINQANQMLDRMRANQAGVDAGNYNALSGTPSAPSCTSCSPAEIALRDLNQWNTDNAARLPNGQGSVSVSGDLFIIRVMWDNEKNGVTGTNCSGNPAVDLTCVSMMVEL